MAQLIELQRITDEIASPTKAGDFPAFLCTGIPRSFSFRVLNPRQLPNPPFSFLDGSRPQTFSAIFAT
jgi:hypothetical protein